MRRMGVGEFDRPWLSQRGKVVDGRPRNRISIGRSRAGARSREQCRPSLSAKLDARMPKTADAKLGQFRDRRRHQRDRPPRPRSRPNQTGLIMANLNAEPFVNRIEYLCDFIDTVRDYALAQVPTGGPMPHHLGSLGFDEPLWVGLGMVGLWATLDTFANRAEIYSKNKCPVCCSKGCVAEACVRGPLVTSFTGIEAFTISTCGASSQKFPIIRFRTAGWEREISARRGSGRIPTMGRVSKVAASTSLGGQFRCRRPKPRSSPSTVICANVLRKAPDCSHSAL